MTLGGAGNACNRRLKKHIMNLMNDKPLCQVTKKA